MPRRHTHTAPGHRFARVKVEYTVEGLEEFRGGNLPEEEDEDEEWDENWRVPREFFADEVSGLV